MSLEWAILTVAPAVDALPFEERKAECVIRLVRIRIEHTKRCILSYGERAGRKALVRVGALQGVLASANSALRQWDLLDEEYRIGAVLGDGCPPAKKYPNTLAEVCDVLRLNRFQKAATRLGFQLPAAFTTV